MHLDVKITLDMALLEITSTNLLYYKNSFFSQLLYVFMYINIVLIFRWWKGGRSERVKLPHPLPKNRKNYAIHLKFGVLVHRHM